MGRSRGGMTTKIHALVDALGLPILLKLTEGKETHKLRLNINIIYDIRIFVDVLSISDP